MSLTEYQKLAVQVMKDGYNLVILGQAGSGKTYTTRYAYNMLSKVKNVSLVASMGIACQAYPTYMGARTLHSWSGIGDGRHSTAELTHMIREEQNDAARKRIRECDILIIDEISMVSMRTFEPVELVCRLSKDNQTAPFGGVQVIAVGDLLQLNPVANQLYGDQGQPCFQHPLWDKIFGHKVVLDVVMRQEEESLVTAISDMARGVPLTKATENLMLSLSRPLGNVEESQVTKLDATNLEVQRHNFEILQRLPGKYFKYAAADEGRTGKLTESMSQKVLKLKKRCKVIPLCNMYSISDKLVNGSCGEVTDCGSDYVEVKFSNPQMMARISQHTFTVCDPVRGSNIAVTKQIPLTLAYALTIHKCQGMALEYVEVDCKSVFKPGQIAVAVGRVKQIKRLRVLNFRSELCFKQTQQTLSHSGSDAKSCKQCDLHVDFSYCKKSNVSVVCEENIEDDSLEMEALNTYMEEQLDEEIRRSTTSIPLVGPCPINTGDMLRRLKDPTAKTRKQKEFNSLLSAMQQQAVDQFCQRNWNKVVGLVESEQGEGESGITEKQSTAILHHWYQYVTDPKSPYLPDLKQMVQSGELQSYHYHVRQAIAVYVRSEVFKRKSEGITVSVSQAAQPTAIVRDRYASGAAAGSKIRYVAGWCIATLKHNYRCRLRSLMQSARYKPEHYEKTKLCVDLLEFLKISQMEIFATTDYPECLQETIERQNVRQGLSHIKDSAFFFFQSLCAITIDLQTDDNLHLYGSEMFVMVNNSVIGNVTQFQQWACSFKSFCSASMQATGESSDILSTCAPAMSEVVSVADAFNMLFDEVVVRFTHVLHAQFRKDYLTQLNAKKKDAHQKEIQKAKASSQSDDFIQLKHIQSDTTKGLKMSHLMLQKKVSQDRAYLQGPFFTKTDIQVLCAAYEVSCRSRATKRAMAQVLREKKIRT